MMGNNYKENIKSQNITKGIKDKINPLLLNKIYNKVINQLNLKKENLLFIDLSLSTTKHKQLIRVINPVNNKVILKGTLDDFTPVKEKMVLYYDGDSMVELLCLLSEAKKQVEKKKMNKKSLVFFTKL